jgi:hypothetical protein
LIEEHENAFDLMRINYESVSNEKDGGGEQPEKHDEQKM